MRNLRDTGVAKLPALPSVSTGNPQLDRWIQAVSERMEVREGARGNPYERAVTLRELEALGLGAVTGGGSGGAAGGVLVKQADGTFATLSVGEFADSIRSTKLYQNLLLRLDDMARFDEVPEQVRAILLNDIAAEAAKRGADIQRLDMKLQSASESLAYTVQEVTASVERAAAGVRDTTFAMANDTRAVAGKVTQVQARLDDVGGVTIEESMLATADRVEGLAGEYMVKINAGGAVAGFGLAASEDPDGVTESSFIVQADKFAVTMPGLSQSIPFGVDASGVYINGSLRINAGGAALQDATSGSDGKSTYAAPVFRRSATVLSVAPAGGTFNFGTNVLTPPTDWFASPPGGTNPMYVSNTTFSISGDTGIASAGAWSAPSLFVQNGTEGASGKSTYAYPVYKRSAAAPATPTGGQYDFGTNTATPPSTWSNTVPSGTDKLYISTTIASITGATGVADSLTWSAPTVLAQDGLQGDQGLQGNPGDATYTWIAYATNATGTTGFTIGANTGQTYIGIANNKTTATESTDPAQYVWSLIKGDQGVPGDPGENGLPTYTWFAYANDATGTSGFTTGAWTNQTYLGIASNKTTATESTNKADYSWSLIKGDKGDTGNASTVPGPTGSRGTAFITSTAASATDAAFTAAGGPNPPIAGDQLLLSNSSGSTIYTRGASSWVNTTALSVNGNAIINGTLAASKIVAGTLQGFTIQTNSSPNARYVLSGTSFQGYNASNVLVSTLDMASGTALFIASGLNAVVGRNTGTGTGVNGESQSSGNGISGSSVTGKGVYGTATSTGVGVEGRSTSYIGGAFYGGTAAPPLYINPNGSLPTSGAIKGSLCVVGVLLYFHNGTSWKQVSLL